MIKNRSFEAIVIGGSWGGMDAVSQIIRSLHEGYPLPIITVLHRAKNVESSLAKILAKHSPIPVKEIEEKEAIKNSILYVAPANYHTLIEKDRTFSLDLSEDVLFSRPSIDVLFESAAITYKERLIGILLTGANSDGSDGIKTIASFGGLTIVQDPAEAESNIMPKAAIAKTAVDFVYQLSEISDFLKSLQDEYGRNN